MSRKRKILKNPPKGKRKSKGGSGSSNPKSVSVESRVKQFPGEHLVVSAGKLFCHACREELTTKMSVLKSHLRSKKTCGWQRKTCRKR